MKGCIGRNKGMKNSFRLAICQMKTGDDKESNVSRAVEMIKRAAENKAEMVVLPEMFNCPYNSSKFPEYCEAEGNSLTLSAISENARKLGLYIVAGSIPETDSGRIYNSSYIFGRRGELIGKHRKMHLFDVDIPGKITFKESKTLTAGEQVTVVDTELCRVGVAVCYDIRFPELARLMALKGAQLIALPAAFNMTTGPAHWELLMRARAVDNQVYVAAASPARDEKAAYVAYGNSMVADPWGSVIARAGGGEEIVYADIDIARVDKIREELPLLKHRRTDVYSVEEKFKR